MFSQVCLSNQKPAPPTPPAQLVQVPDNIPLGGDAASYLEQSFWVSLEGL